MTGAVFFDYAVYGFGCTIGPPQTQFAIEKFNPETGYNSETYMDYLDFPGLEGTTYDIAYTSEGIWLAREHSSIPIIRYSTSGQITGEIPSSLIACAAGLTIDSDGFLWVSDPNNDKIYKVNTSSSSSVEDETSGNFADVLLIPQVNPFSNSAFLDVAGYSDGTAVEVYDLKGKLLETGEISSSSYFWDASEQAAGTYLVRVSDTSNTSVARLVKI